MYDIGNVEKYSGSKRVRGSYRGVTSEHARSLWETILDFGLARKLEDAEGARVIETLRCMPPEMLEGNVLSGRRRYLFIRSLGGMLSPGSFPSGTADAIAQHRAKPATTKLMAGLQGTLGPVINLNALDDPAKGLTAVALACSRMPSSYRNCVHLCRNTQLQSKSQQHGATTIARLRPVRVTLHPNENQWWLNRNQITIKIPGTPKSHATRYFI